MDWNNFEAVKSYCNNNKLMQTSSKMIHRNDRGWIRPTSLDWSCDGKYLASTSKHYTAYVYRCDSDKSFKVYPLSLHPCASTLCL